MDKKERKETKYGERVLGTPEWKLGPIQAFLKGKFPNEKEIIDDFLFAKAPVTQRERMDYPGFYKGFDGSWSEIQPLEMTDQEAEAYFIKDYNRFKEFEGLNE